MRRCAIKGAFYTRRGKERRFPGEKIARRGRAAYAVPHHSPFRCPMLDVDLLTRRTTHFVLWRPKQTATAPRLILGQFQPGNPPALTGEKQFDLRPAAGFADLWELPAADCGLAGGQIYHYWFEVDDSDPGKDPPARIRCGDPFAHTVDWR